MKTFGKIGLSGCTQSATRHHVQLIEHVKPTRGKGGRKSHGEGRQGQQDDGAAHVYMDPVFFVWAMQKTNLSSRVLPP